AAHEEVAKYYDVSTVNLANTVAQDISAGRLTWKVYGGVHPATPGNAIAAKMIVELLGRTWADSLDADAMPVDRKLPDKALDEFSYSSGRFIDPKQAHIKSGWTLEVPDWKKLAGSKRERFTAIPMLAASEPGAEASLEFSGTAIGAYIVAGPDAGIVEASID